LWGECECPAFLYDFVLCREQYDREQALEDFKTGKCVITDIDWIRHTHTPIYFL